MVLEETVNELASVLPIEILEKVSGLVLVLKTLGVVAVLYVIYAAVMGFFTYRRMKKVEHIEGRVDVIASKINSIDRKLDKLLKKKR